jgi:hypothetical protein
LIDVELISGISIIAHVKVLIAIAIIVNPVALIGGLAAIINSGDCCDLGECAITIVVE